LSATARLAVRVPAAVGAKLIEIVQVAATGSVVGVIGQSLICA
jgi:hypothetical protein